MVVIGIGGMSLGTRAIYDALGSKAKILFADTTDPTLLTKILDALKHEIKNPNELILNIASKSGATTETLANTEIILAKLGRRYHKSVAVTTEQDLALWMAAKKQGFKLLSIPKAVEGRYSVLSNVGIFPLAAAGIDVAALRRGAMHITKLCLLDDPQKNPALASAAILYHHYKAGKKINVGFYFHPELESLGKWYAQLVAESLGKNGQGFTPQVAIGSTDLHSLAQLYLDGPADKVTTFISTAASPREPRVPSRTLLGGQHLAGKSAAEIMAAILKGTKRAYAKKKLPFMEVVLPRLNAESLGEFMQFKMMETIFLGKLMGVNAFDQPAVELYKKETKRILSQ